VLLLHKKVTEMSLALDAPESGEQFAGLILEAMREDVGNDFLEVTFSETYIKTLKKRFVAVKHADKKNNSRGKAFEQLLNPLSLCALVTSYLKRGISPELFYSSDDVSVLLNKMNEKLSVITTAAAKKILAAKNIGVAANLPEQKQRVVAFNLTISGGGCLVCKVLKFADRTFEQYADKPLVLKISDSNFERIYIMLYQYGMDDAIVEKCMYTQCIEKEVEAHRASLILREREKLVVVPPCSDEEGGGGDSDHEEGGGGGHGDGDEEGGADEEGDDLVATPHRHDKELVDEVAQVSQELGEWAALFCDGAHAQIKALMDKMTKRIKKKGLKFALGKYSGGCSMTESANDQGKMHQVLHNGFKSPSYRYGTIKELPGAAWKALRVILSGTLDPASLKSVWQCMQESQDFLAKAFQPLSIKSAWKKSGVVPYNPKVILSKCPHF
jgi:hypothetical protein